MATSTFNVHPAKLTVLLEAYLRRFRAVPDLEFWEALDEFSAPARDVKIGTPKPSREPGRTEPAADDPSGVARSLHRSPDRGWTV